MARAGSHFAHLFVGALALIGAVYGGSARGQSADQVHTYCVNAGMPPHFASELQIASCTALIQSGHETPENLAEDFDNRGRGYRDSPQHDYARAIADFTQAIALNPHSLDAFSDRGAAYANDPQHDYSRAIADFTQAMALGDPFALYNRGLTYDAQHDYARAIADYTEAIARAPDDDRILASRGVAYANGPQHDDARAIADFTQAIAISPRYLRGKAYLYRGQIYFAQRDYVHAVADFDQEIQIHPQDADAFFYRGQVYDSQRDYVHAIADYDQAILLQPANATWLNGRCWTRAVWGQQLDQALADCDASLRIANDPLTLDSRGLVHLRRSEWQAAFADYDAAVRGDANLTGSLYGRGIAQLRLGRTAEGRADISAATARDAGLAQSFAGYGITP